MKMKKMCIVLLLCMVASSGCSQKYNGVHIHSNTDINYEIKTVLDDDIFIRIIDGEMIPVEIKYGIGEEGGYTQYSTKDPETINEYIEAFRMVHISKIITNKDEMIFVTDGIQDYTFVMEDGTEITLGTDLNLYVFDKNRNREFILENTEKLNELNRMLLE